VVCIESTALAQTDEQRAAARAAATEAVHAFDEGRYADAADLCKRAESLMHAPTHLLLLARSQVRLGHLVAAQEAYFKIKSEELAHDAPKPFVKAQQAAADELAALAPRVPKLKITVEGAANPKEVSLTIDGASFSAALIGLASPVDPGSHVIAGKTASARAEPVTVTIAEGSTQSVTLKFEASPTPVGESTGAQKLPEGVPEAPPPAKDSGGVPVGAWVGFGVGAAGLLAGGVFVLLNRLDRTAANNDCNAIGCPESKRSDITSLDNQANTAAALSWISLGVGVAGVGTGAVLYLTKGKKASSDTPAAQLQPWVGPQGGGLGLTGVF
jgi:hypothetical protein